MRNYNGSRAAQLSYKLIKKTADRTLHSRTIKTFLDHHFVDHHISIEIVVVTLDNYFNNKVSNNYYFIFYSINFGAHVCNKMNTGRGRDHEQNRLL